MDTNTVMEALFSALIRARSAPPPSPETAVAEEELCVPIAVWSMYKSLSDSDPKRWEIIDMDCLVPGYDKTVNPFLPEELTEEEIRCITRLPCRLVFYLDSLADMDYETNAFYRAMLVIMASSGGPDIVYPMFWLRMTVQERRDYLRVAHVVYLFLVNMCITSEPQGWPFLMCKMLLRLLVRPHIEQEFRSVGSRRDKSDGSLFIAWNVIGVACNRTGVAGYLHNPLQLEKGPGGTEPNDETLFCIKRVRDDVWQMAPYVPGIPEEKWSDFTSMTFRSTVTEPDFIDLLCTASECYERLIRESPELEETYRVTVVTMGEKLFTKIPKLMERSKNIRSSIDAHLAVSLAGIARAYRGIGSDNHRSWDISYYYDGSCYDEAKALAAAGPREHGPSSAPHEDRRERERERGRKRRTTKVVAATDAQPCRDDERRAFLKDLDILSGSDEDDASSLAKRSRAKKNAQRRRRRARKTKKKPDKEKEEEEEEEDDFCCLCFETYEGSQWHGVMCCKQAICTGCFDKYTEKTGGVYICPICGKT